MLEVLFVCISVAAAFLTWLLRNRGRLPPGPTGLPIFGNMLSIDKRAHVTISQWQQKYGDVFMYFVGRKRFIVISNFETARKFFTGDLTSGRDQSLGLGLFKRRGLLVSEGDLWREHRRFTISTLRNLGMGKSWLEDAIIDEANDLCDHLASLESLPVDPKGAVTHSISNIICALMFGKRFQHSDKRFRHLTKLISVNSKISSSRAALQAFPFLRYLPGKFRDGYHTYRRNTEESFAFIKTLVDEHIAKVPSEDGNDYIDAYVKEGVEKDKQHTNGNPAPHTFDEPQLLTSILNLFIGGTEPTAATLLWTIVFMLENPDIMRKVQEEIDNNVPSDRPVQMQDKGLLPYTEATILEVQRCCLLTPLGVFHQALGELVVDGYTVPQGSLLLPNICFMHKDPRYWENPEKFDPSRFLDTYGKVKRPDGFAAFSIGKRACLGESLARMELYLCFATILRRFDLSLPAGETISHDDYEMSTIISPQTFKVIFTPRYLP